MPALDVHSRKSFCIFKPQCTILLIQLTGKIPLFMQCQKLKLESRQESARLCLPANLIPRFQVMKTYHMYNTDSINAESKLKEAEKQEEKQMGRSGRQDDRQTPRSPDTLASIKSDEKPVRRSSVKKIEKMKEKVSKGESGEGRWRAARERGKLF